MIYHNYHKHDHKGNIRALDVVVKLKDYCERAVELGHTTIFTTNHGMQGDIFEATVLAQEYGLKLIVGAECYYVKNRFEKDRSNKHIVVIALNDEGVRQLNKIISISNVDGYYYKPRIDYELLMSLNPKNFVITTACVAGILKDEELVLKLHDKFKSNFFVEVQNHNVDTQKYWNKLALEYNRKYGIGLIHANDSHYIRKEDKKYRDLFLKAKDIFYSDEGEFILDYPSYEEIVERYKKQGVLNNAQIIEALENTHVFDKAEPITIINKDIKLPSMSKNPNYDLKKVIFDAWQKEKKNIAPERIKEYEEAIRYEMDIIERTHMEDYFLLDYKVVERGIKEYGGMLTKTGRGCFTADSLVHTDNGLKSIKDVQIGDKVITKDGKFEKVYNTMEYDIEEEMIQINNGVGYKSICTLDHKILIYRDGKEQWVEAQYLKRGDCTKYIIDKDSYWYSPIDSVLRIPKMKVKVYDISVENEHNYMLDGMIVHNSAPSFYTTKLLGLTDIDRLESPITLFPTRFMSAERILLARSLPD